MENILFVYAIVFMLLVIPTCVAMYIYYTKSKITTAEWAKKQVKEQKRVKEAQKNPIWWSMHL